MSIVDEIKARLDTLTYIQQYVPLKKAGKHWKGCCPFHSEKSPSFMVDAERGTWRCYGACAEGGDLIAFAMKRNGWSFVDALEELSKRAGVEFKRQSPQSAAAAAHHDHLRGLLQAAAAFYAGRVALTNFAQERGLTDETVAAFELGMAHADWRLLSDHLLSLGYSEDALVEAGVARKSEKGRVYDTLRNRIIFPIWDERGRVAAFAGRAIDPGDNPKYLNTPESPLFAKSRLLYGLHRARAAIRDTGMVVVVEGYMDVISAHQAGFTNVVAQMGTALSETQLKLIAQDVTIVLALDGDAAGQEAANRQLERLVKLHRNLRILALPEGEDPDDIIRRDPDAWRSLVADAPTAGEYIIQLHTQDVTPRMSIEDRWARAKAAIPLLVFCEVDVVRREYMQRLAMRLYFKADALLHFKADALMQLQDAPPPPAEPSSPVEMAIICTLVHRPALYDELTEALVKLGVPALQPADFEDVRAQIVFRAFLDARRDWPGDPKGHLFATLEPELAEQLPADGVVTRRRFMQFISRQRQQIIQQEIEGMETSPLADIMTRSQQRVRLQQWERELTAARTAD